MHRRHNVCAVRIVIQLIDGVAKVRGCIPNKNKQWGYSERNGSCPNPLTMTKLGMQGNHLKWNKKNQQQKPQRAVMECRYHKTNPQHSVIPKSDNAQHRFCPRIKRRKKKTHVITISSFHAKIQVVRMVWKGSRNDGPTIMIMMVQQSR